MHAIGERRNGERCRRGDWLDPLIGVSRSAQAVNSEERVEQTKAQTRAYLTRYAALNVRGVHAGRSLDEDRSKPNSR
jgi:hypothetical protein